MDLDQLECFVCVADQSSFTKAALVLRMAQPRLSRAVRGLEVELRQTLFHRNGRGVRLTEPGERFLAHCRGILVQLARARAELEHSRGEAMGQVVLGFPHSIARVVTVPCAVEFRRRFPQGLLRITEGLTVHLQEWLLAGRIDIALLHDPLPTPAIETLPLRRELLFLVGPRGGAGSGNGAPIRVRDLAEIPLVMPGRPHPMRMVVETELANLGLRPNIVLEIDSIGGVIDAVGQGLGFAIVSLNALGVRQAANRFIARKIVSPTLPSVLVIARSAERPVTALMQQTLGLLETMLPELLPRDEEAGVISLAHSS
jgi:LysR family nitrogen assimilation transcriptional regulator